MKTNALGAQPRPQSFRELLQAELARRCTSNPRYSLRAFARALAIDHSTLSQVLRGKRRITEPSIRKLGAALDLSEEAIEGHVARRAASSEDISRQRQRLQKEAIEVISRWQHYAILELTRLEAFEPDSRWISRVLDLPVDEVNQALMRLMHFGLLRMESEDRWVAQTTDTVTPLDDLPATVLEQLNRQLAEQSTAMTSSAGRGSLTTSTLAGRTDRLSLATEILESARERAAVVLSEPGAPCDNVFQLQIAIYPLSHIHKET